MNGNIASSAGPSWSKTSPGSPSNIHHSSVDQQRTARTSSIASVRWSRRSWVSTRPATARVIRAGHAARPCRVLASTSARNAVSMSSAPVRSQDPGGRVVGDDRALAHEQQPVAALGLVHDVAGDEHRGAGVGEPVEQRPQVAAQHRVEADGRLVEHEQVGARRAARPRGWPGSAGRR